ncbi:MAG TPA: anthranilate synthase component I family protein [Chitinophagaceae bacterium]|nr:anthranilate synthase component I family protein [Chitinophagaceae bacterium]
MNRIAASFDITAFPGIQSQMLNWASRFNICCFLDDHHYGLSPHTYECLLGAGAIQSFQTHSGKAFRELRDFSNGLEDWLFGHFAYDLKNETEQLTSAHPDRIGFADMFFFVPETVIQLQRNTITISCIGIDPVEVFEAVCKTTAQPRATQRASLEIQSRFTKNEYLDVVRALQKHILRGDCYEINFCQEFFASPALIDPVQAYEQLSAISPNPFTAFYKTDDKYLLCASPERYLKKSGNRIVSQPVKGTWERDHISTESDQQKKQELYNSAKDRSENVMIVDLVRNDLSKICEESTVRVDELFGVYSFPQVHQMISTVSGQLKAGLHWTEAIQATFPMGSMTGAPKKRVMELIEQYERTRRGLFSGAVGYVTPDGDFDFNVVIRSILYNTVNSYLSYQVGSGITFYSDPEKEYEECLLKAAAIKKVLGSS